MTIASQTGADTTPAGLKGLSSPAARERLKAYGPNRLVRQPSGARLRELIATVADPMVVMLLAAAGFYLALGNRGDAYVLIAAAAPVLVVDVLFESRARGALKRLAGAVAPRARVVRDNAELEIPTEQIVPGDLLVMREGDVVHADGVVRWAANLALDESQLTGESEPQEKVSAGEGIPDSVAAQTRFYAGSLVISGHGWGEVTATGAATRFGNIARLVGEATPGRTPLEAKTASMARRLLAIALAASIAIFAMMIARGESLSHAFLYAITLAISAVPEEYPLVMTLFLSLGAWRLGSRGVLVRRLASVETLGSTTVICLDKTGTLTRGRYALETNVILRPGATRDLLETAALACEINAADPVDRAIVEYCRVGGVELNELHARWRLLYDYPFEMRGKHMSHVWERTDNAEAGADGRAARIAAKGALEGILEHCAITPALLAEAEAANAKLANAGMRVLAVAGRTVILNPLEERPSGAPWTQSDGAAPAPSELFSGVRDDDERSLELYGLLGFRDPLRPEAAGAIEACQRGGIAVKLITGDHALTAHAIAEAAGISHEDQAILTGEQIDAMSPAQLAEAARSSSIFARVRPEQKYAIVDALVRAGEVVAMTGDGINDAPALRRANIGVSMGQRGTEVARAVASLVLLDDDFGALVDTIREGRQIFDNIQRAFLFLAGFKTMVISLALLAPLIGLPVLLLLVQIVWLELIVHPIAALVFEGERASDDAMGRPPRPPSSPLMPAGPALRSAITGALLSAGALALYAHRLALGVEYARGVAMTVVIGGSMVLAWAELAGRRPWWRAPLGRPLRFAIIMAGVAATLPLCMNWHPLADLLHMRPIGAADFALAGVVVIAATGWRAFGWRSDAALTLPPR